uniref:Uncharacterized protein n=1 Tax=Arundo donax TaxID=35708 RepID=A0A0A9BNG5_ARUDO
MSIHLVLDNLSSKTLSLL